MGRRGVLLDRDGTINIDHGYVGAVEDVHFVEGAIEAIARLNAAGIPVAVVSNQAGVARGMYELADVDLVHKHMSAEMAQLGAHVDAWLFCPYHPDGIVASFARVSQDRKPAPGMALAAATALDLDLSDSWVVGDRQCDVGLARAVGARPFLIDPDGGATGDADVTVVTDLASAVEQILTDHSRSATPASASERPTFPESRYADAGAFASAYADELSRAMASVDRAQVRAAARLLDAAYDRGATVFSCGNGGSASIANHFQCDHVKGVRIGTDLLTRVYSLSTNMEILSAIANDNGYENVFDFQLQSQARPGDVLVAVSSSGRSPNIVRALEWCAGHGVETVALTGFTGGPARDLATVSIHVDSLNYGVIEDSHQACMHLLAQYVRQSRMSANDVAATVF
ncbi:HAD-IIIA family hydrolase [Intrasporangium sp. YIM S08009]|uniref:HAD-IIIA family hydrolase n=1 Tax=Intrasporangium zincisolvens TaxID=3080018 RepID=UPI002B05D602|nr:HAD-IIIA family hydrolase [Intrasporangium sp. YIM S08009]